MHMLKKLIVKAIEDDSHVIIVNIFALYLLIGKCDQAFVKFLSQLLLTSSTYLIDESMFGEWVTF